jgi:hypothetical protein
MPRDEEGFSGARRTKRALLPSSHGYRRELGTGIDSKLLEDVREVGLRGRARDEHPLGDLRVRQAPRDELGHLQLGRRQ